MAGEDRKWREKGRSMQEYLQLCRRVEQPASCVVAVIMCKRICGLYSSNKPSQQDWQSQPAALPHRMKLSSACAFCDLLIHSPSSVVAIGRAAFFSYYPSPITAQCILSPYFPLAIEAKLLVFFMASTHMPPFCLSRMSVYTRGYVEKILHVTRRNDFKILFFDSG